MYSPTVAHPSRKRASTDWLQRPIPLSMLPTHSSDSSTSNGNGTTSHHARHEGVAAAPKFSRLGVGVIGCGYWGPNLLRNFHSNRDCHLIAVADLNHDRLAWAQSLYPHIKATSVVDDLIADPNIEAIAIATPVHTHFELAMRCLRAGKHI